MTDLGAPFGESDLLRGTRYRLHTPVLILAIILSTASLLYYSVLAPERFGAYHDDSIYAATAKALATSQGYKIISLPLEPAQTKYPPFYPFLLSLIWRAYPQFPENIVLLTMLSTIATLSFLALAYRYLTKHGYTTEWQALIVVGLAAINWRTMILATSIYSEMVYAAFSVAALYLAERGEASKRGRDVLLGIVIGMAFLTRTSGLTLLLSITVYYVLRRRWGKALVVFGVGSHQRHAYSGRGADESGPIKRLARIANRHRKGR